MNISHTMFKHCDLLKLEGRVDSATAPQLAAAIDAITDEGRFKIVLDFGQLEFMSSAGLRVLVNAQKNCKRYNRGEVVIAAAPKNIFAALDLAGFTILFKMYDDSVSAVGNF